MLAAGAKALGDLLQDIGSGRRDEAILCSCGERMESLGLKEKPLLMILGWVPYKRVRSKKPAELQITESAGVAIALTISILDD